MGGAAPGAKVKGGGGGLPGSGDQDRSAELRVCEIDLPPRAEPRRRCDCRSCPKTFRKKSSARCDTGDERRSQRSMVLDRSAFRVWKSGAARVAQGLRSRCRADSRGRQYSNRVRFPKDTWLVNIVMRPGLA